MRGWMARRRRERAALRERAEQQDRWAARGDTRGIYGPDGATLMRAVEPAPGRVTPLTPPGPDLAVAEVVGTDAELRELLAARLPNWRYAAFVSVLVQRRAAVADRLRDVRMGFAAAPGPTLSTAVETALFCTERLAELSELIDGIDSIMASTAFQEVFGAPHDGDSADADADSDSDSDAIVHAAGRLMDYHDRALSLAERCRAVRVPADCRELQRDLALVALLPLDGFVGFIDQFRIRVREMADVARYATGDVQLDPVQLTVADDDEVLERVSARLRRIAAGG